MADLTRDQIDFLYSQEIPLSHVFDATGMRKVDYAKVMKDAGFSFAYGTTPCAKGGHSLRTRQGHCIQCSTSVISYQTRYRAPGYVYIAGSPGARLLKIGTTDELDRRE